MEFIKLNIQMFGAFAEKENTSLVSKSGGNKGRVYCKFTEANLSDNDKTNNQTRITAYAEYSQGGSYSGYSTPKLRLTWYDDNENINGKVLGTTEAKSLASKAKVKVQPAEFVVKHKDDGTLKGYVKAEWIWTGGGYCCNSGSATTNNTSLTSIPRAKTISAMSADIGYDTTILLGQTSSAYTATIEYVCGSLSGKVIEKTPLTTIPWKIPTSFYSQLSSTDKEITVTLKATTYSGSTQIGSTQTTTIKARVNEQDNKPTAYLDVEDVNEATKILTGNANKVILNASNMLCNVQGDSKNGATIESMIINGIRLTDFTYRTPTEGTSENITEIALDSYTFDKAPTNVFTLTVTDSRGFTNNVTASNKKTLEKVDYFIPKISNDTLFKRNSPTDGKVKLKYNGTFFNRSFGAKSNTLTVYYEYKLKSASSYTRVNLTPTINGNNFSGELTLDETYDYEQVYSFRLVVVDALYAIVYNQDVAKGQPTYWWNDNGIHTSSVYASGIWSTGKVKGNNVVADNYIQSLNGFRGTRLANGQGTSGYMYAFDMTTNSQYQNQYITFDIIQRNRTSHVKLLFTSSTTAGTMVVNNAVKSGNSEVYYVNTNNVFKFYIKKSEAYDDIEICNMQKGAYMAGTAITWKNQTVSSLPSGYMEIKDASQTVLYNNTNGSNGTITLSQPASNYGYIEIFYRDNDNTYSSVRVYNPATNKYVNLITCAYWSTTYYMKQKRVEINGSTIAPNRYCEISLTNAPKVGISASNNIYITRVVGYPY